MTPAERRLWARLRANRLAGLKWARQEPIGPYIVDFYCSAARVVVELDGYAHLFIARNDQLRQEWLEDQGLRVVRFSNTAVFERIDGVMAIISEACSGSIPGLKSAP